MNFNNGRVNSNIYQTTLGSVFRRYEPTPRVEDEEAEDDVLTQVAMYESIANVREPKPESEKEARVNEDEAIARLVQQQEDEVTASYLGHRPYEVYKNHKENTTGNTPSDQQYKGEERVIFGSGPDGLNFGNISPNRNNINNHLNYLNNNTNNNNNNNTTTTTTISTSNNGATTTTTTTTSNRRPERPQRQWGGDIPLSAYGLGTSRTTLFPSTNNSTRVNISSDTSLYQSYLNSRARPHPFIATPVPVPAPSTPSTPQHQQDQQINTFDSVRIRRAIEVADERIARQIQGNVGGVPLVNNVPQLGTNQDVHNNDEQAISDEQLARMLQREETLTFRRLLGEDLANGLTDEDILNAHPDHDQPFPFYVPRVQEDSDGEYYSDSDEENELNLDNMSYEELLALGDRIGTVSKGATKAQISQCPQKRYDESSVKEKTCSICQEDFERGSMLRVLPCSHCYHILCIDQWLSVQAKCPVCQHSIKDSM